MARRNTVTSLLLILGCHLLASESSGAPAAPARAREMPFPAPAAIRHQVEFWVRVYVDIGTDAGFVHDDRALSVAYESLRVSTDARRSEGRIKARLRHWRGVLEGLAQGAPAVTPDARIALALWRRALGREPTSQDFSRAGKRLRFQRGQRDMFKAGMIRSGRYEAEIRRIFEARGMPGDLAYLPHVESSYQTHARSKSGAAGIWQFMPSTGRRYLRIDGAVDERLAPIRATLAAAKHLRANYDRLGTWPLAITGYNHGATGMRRAAIAVGSTDIATIIERYDGRNFGFASRNFYAQFLAARRVARDYRRHFGPLRLSAPDTARTVSLPFYADARDVLQTLGLRREVLAALNPSLRDAVFRSEKYIPKDFELRIPDEMSGATAVGQLARIPPQRRYASQRVPRVHVVRRGETLGHIAKRHGVSISSLVALNGLKSRHLIRAGQTLELGTNREPVMQRPEPAPSFAAPPAEETGTAVPERAQSESLSAGAPLLREAAFAGQSQPLGPAARIGTRNRMAAVSPVSSSNYRTTQPWHSVTARRQQRGDGIASVSREKRVPR